MSEKTVLRGMSTIIFSASDLAAAQEWYTEVLGIPPYFNRPGYIEFRLGDYQHELGIVDSRYIGQLNNSGSAAGGTAAPSGAIVYWQVDDLEQTLTRLIALGAQMIHAPRKFGEGFIGACVADPFGNLLGIMHNAHYLEILETLKGSE